MPDDLLPARIPEQPDAAIARPREPTLVESFFLGRKATTIRVYRENLLRFADTLGLGDLDQLAAFLVAGGHGRANTVMHNFKGAALEKGWTPAYVNNHLSAVRSFVKLLRMRDLVEWTVDVENVRGVRAYRDTRGPGLDVVAKLYDAVEKLEPPRRARERAILRLISELALRRGEIASLDLEHVEGGSLWIMGKGRREREAVTLTPSVREALDAWIATRGTTPGPLFTSFDPAGPGGRLTGGSVYRIVRELGETIGSKVWTHGLRHTAITLYLNESGGDVRGAQRLGRHMDPKTTMVYDDAREDLAGRAANVIATAIARHRAPS